MSMTSVFCDVDDFCLIFEPQWHKQLICNDKKSPVISKLTLSEIMTIIICFHQSAFRDFKHYYLSHIVRHKSDSFPNLVSYNRFVELMKTTLIPLTVYLKTQCMGKPTGLSFIDSTPIVVCDNHRINNHKVFREEAKRGKTSTGWKYGFKLHLIINHCGEILSFCLSTANVVAYWDNAVVERFFGSLKHDWLFKVYQPTRKHMKRDVAAYMKYYNTERLHSANSDETPVRLEQLFYRGAQKDERLAGESCIGVGSQQTKRVSYV